MGAAAPFIVISVFYVGTSILEYQYRPKPPKPKGRIVNGRSTQEILKLVYGEVLVGGNDVFIEADGQYLWIVQTLSEGPCQGVSTDSKGDIIYFSGKRIQEYSGYESHYFMSGELNQSVEPHLHAALPTFVETMHGVSYIVFKLKYNPNKYYGIPTREVLLKGKMLYDFRYNTTVYSNNPVLELYDYLTNSVYGLSKEASEIELGSWSDAATYCDNKGYMCNIAFDSRDTAKTIIDTILSYFKGTIISNQGQLSLLYADTTEESPVMVINDSHLIQNEDGTVQMTISQPSVFDKIDGLIVSYTDPTNDYKPNELIIGEDVGVLEEMDLTGINDKKIAGELATYYLERRQLDRTINVTLRDNAVQLLAHDLIMLTCSTMGIYNQLMRVTKTSIQSDGSVSVSLQYENDLLYNSSYDIKEATDVYTCNLPDPYAEPSQVENVVFSEETYNLKDKTYNRLKISWEISESYPYIDRVEVWVSSDGENYTHYNTGTDGSFFQPVEIGETWFFKFLPINIWKVKLADERASTWIYQVQGKTAAPLSSVQNFNILVAGDTLHLSWDKVPDQDVIGYEIRYGLVWEQSIPLFIVDATSKTIIGMKPGNHTFLIKAKDALNNYSEYVAEQVVSVIGPPNYVEKSSTSYDFTSGTFSNTERYYSSNYGYVLRVFRQNLNDKLGIYVSNNRLICIDDMTSYLVNGQTLNVDCGSDGIKSCTVLKSELKNYCLLMQQAGTKYPKMSQNLFNLTVGHLYQVSFCVKRFSTSGDNVRTSLFGTYVDDTVNSSWCMKFCYFTANSTTTTLIIETTNILTLGIAFIRVLDVTTYKTVVSNGHFAVDNSDWIADGNTILTQTDTIGPPITDLTINETSLTNNLLNYDILDYNSNLEGSWESPIIDLTTSLNRRWWILYSLIFEDSSTSTWTNLFLANTNKTWNDILINNLTWIQAFNANEVGDMDAVFYWSDDGTTWNNATFFEILSMEVTARYIKFIIHLKDYSINRKIMLRENLLLKSNF